MGLRRRLAQHWQLKLLSLIFAAALWVFVVTEDTGEAVYTVPLDLAGLPPDLEVAALGVETVDVRVRGLRSLLGQLREGDLHVEVAVRDPRPGEHLLPILPEHVRAPRGVRVVRVTPSRVRIALEAVTLARVGIAPRVVGRPAEGYAVAGVRVEPREIEVRAPAGERWREVETAPVDVEGARQTVTREVAVVLPAGMELRSGSGRVTVTVEIGRQR